MVTRLVWEKTNQIVKFLDKNRGSPIAYSNLNTFENHEKYQDRVDSDNI